VGRRQPGRREPGGAPDDHDGEQPTHPGRRQEPSQPAAHRPRPPDGRRTASAPDGPKGTARDGWAGVGEPPGWCSRCRTGSAGTLTPSARRSTAGSQRRACRGSCCTDDGTPTATHLLASGHDARLVSARLGHASVAFTLHRYGHVMPRHRASAAATVAALDGAGITSLPVTNYVPTSLPFPYQMPTAASLRHRCGMQTSWWVQ